MARMVLETLAYFTSMSAHYPLIWGRTETEGQGGPDSSLTALVDQVVSDPRLGLKERHREEGKQERNATDNTGGDPFPAQKILIFAQKEKKLNGSRKQKTINVTINKTERDMRKKAISVRFQSEDSPLHQVH